MPLGCQMQGAVAKYIPQSSSIEKLLAIKGKKGQRGDFSWRLQAVITVIIWTWNVGCAVSWHSCNTCKSLSLRIVFCSRYKLWHKYARWKGSTDRNTRHDIKKMFFSPTYSHCSASWCRLPVFLLSPAQLSRISMRYCPCYHFKEATA